MSRQVTVVVTSFNYGRYIGAALDSVRAQTTADFECIVVDDGSTDNSVAIIESFLNDPRFQLVTQQNRGVSYARNVGIGLATTPFIAFLDADDVWQPEKLQHQLDRFRADPALGVVYTRRTIIDDAGIDRPAADPRRSRARLSARCSNRTSCAFLPRWCGRMPLTALAGLTTSSASPSITIFGCE